MRNLKHNIIISFTLILSCLLFSCKQFETKPYNAGINIIPAPQHISLAEGVFILNSKTNIYASNLEAERVANFFASKLNQATGYPFNVVSSPKKNTISILINSTFDIVKEGYQLNISEQDVTIMASTAQGAFYAMQTLMQLLPAEIESPNLIKNIKWVLPCVEINDYPRFDYRGVLLDPCRHFIPVERVKKQIDVMALYKINNMHFHLTEDQGWRIEIKKYPKLTEIGSTRVEGDGIVHKGFYTQAEIKEIVDYASERFITVVPELEIPGHELAAIAAYPELSCQSKQVTPRIIWGVEDIVMCPGKGIMFTFLEDVIEEMVQLFPSTYFHIGGDECPKTSWRSCIKCQELIKDKGFKSDDNHTAEDYLQSYIVRHMENVLMKHGKRLIGWDEILEGGLSPNATVMSWRGESGGIQAAAQGHDVIMASHGNGMYLDQYQGDYKIEPTAIGGYTSLERTYNYNPVPDTLVTLGQQHRVIGVQSNIWSEYMYTPDIMEYRMYPRVLALSEIAWTDLKQKNYKDFERRINNAYVRLDGHDINYHIPQPEQRYGSCNFVAFTDSATLDFTTSRPIKVVYTTNGEEPTPSSTEYNTPLIFSQNTALKIRSVLPSGNMSPTSTIIV